MNKAYLETGEVQRLEQAANYMRDKLLIRLLFRLGCRVSEALALEVKDIDFEHSVVSIVHLKSRVHLSCPQCSARLGRNHAYCPRCGGQGRKGSCQGAGAPQDEDITSGPKYSGNARGLYQTRGSRHP